MDEVCTKEMDRGEFESYMEYLESEIRGVPWDLVEKYLAGERRFYEEYQLEKEWENEQSRRIEG
jgi:hypothetical protein